MTEIKGFENYLIYEDGNIYSKYYKKFLTLKKDDKSGYLRITLYENKKKQRFYLHRLLAEHFIPNDDETKQLVDHVDRDRENNDLSNLRWVNYAESNCNRGLFKNNKLREKYIWESVQQSGKKGHYNYYYKFKITNIHQKYYNALYYSLEDVIKIRDEFCKKNNINL